VKALDAPAFTAEELGQIDAHAREGGVNIWRMSSAA
jgi:hypothetical protein